MPPRWIGVLGIASASVVLALQLAHADHNKARKKEQVGKGFWKILVKPGAKWVLHDTIGDRANTITIETQDVHRVAGADVARLRWTARSKTDSHDMSNDDLFAHIAVTAAGLYILPADADDAAIAARLKQKPSRSDPPKPYKSTKQNHGRYLVIDRNGLVCVGNGPLPGDGPCEDTCFGELCISGTEGIVQLSGTWAPDNNVFTQDGFEN